MVDTGKACALIEDFALQGGTSLVLTGGEPLEHAGLPALTSAAHAHGLDLTLFSMGITEDGEPVSESLLAQLGGVSLWRVSLHSSTQVEHDRLTNSRGWGR